MTTTIAGIQIPDSMMAREATELVRDTETELLYHHSRRVFLFGALAGQRKQLKYDPELLYIGAMFHDMGLVAPYNSEHERFEVDGANAAREFLRRHRIGEDQIEQVWTAIALHTTPGIPQHMKPVIALVTAGVEMDVLGLAYDEFSEQQREEVTHAHPARLALQGRHHRCVRAWHDPQAAYDVRQREGRRARTERSALSSREFLHDDSGFGVEVVSDRLAN
ncbi:hypothetical protein HDG35_001612 [Paraburkholderia sp. JPY681]|nr:hypothetical protein [Paraburkholderia atlantica]